MQIECLAPDDAAFAQVFAIYREAIDPSEQKMEAALREMLRQPTSRFLVAHNKAGVQGFAILWLPEGGDIWSLEYMGVAPAHRGRGLGALLFAASAAAGEGRIGIIEVEAPFGPEQRRRLAFYARLGCRRLGAIDWLLPLRTHGLPPPMQLLAHGAGDAVARDTVRCWLSRMYVEIYGQALDDPRIDEMLAGEADRVNFVDLNAPPATPS